MDVEYVRSRFLLEANGLRRLCEAVGEFCSGRDPLVGGLKRGVPLIDYLYDANTRYLSITGD